MNTNKKAVVIIPALEPGDELIPYIDELITAGLEKIIVINDGSNPTYDPIFNAISEKSECVVLKHAINLGKGRALKNALNYYLNMTDYSDYCGVITADSDGQHGVKDVLALQDELCLEKKELILGVRDFDDEKVPFKSKYGNRITRTVFSLFHGVKLTDTQTGLRAIPNSIIPGYIDLFGERFEYETNMLVYTAINQIPFKEIPIETVYLDNNSGTHFNPIKDSIAIYKLLFSTFFKFSLSSISSFVIDIALFQFVIMLMANMAESWKIGLATVIARVASSLYNYYINRTVVFRSKSNSISSAIRYYSLVIIQMSLSAGLVYLLYNLVHLPETITKVIVDTILFFLSYRIQKSVIFR